jgi:hypothetical protein
MISIHSESVAVVYRTNGTIFAKYFVESLEHFMDILESYPAEIQDYRLYLDNVVMKISEWKNKCEAQITGKKNIVSIPKKELTKILDEFVGNIVDKLLLVPVEKENDWKFIYKYVSDNVKKECANWKFTN